MLGGGDERTEAPRGFWLVGTASRPEPVWVLKGGEARAEGPLPLNSQMLGLRCRILFFAKCVIFSAAPT